METPGCPWRGQTRSGRGGGPGHLGAAGRKGGEEGRVRGGCTRQKPAPEGEGLDLELVAGGPATGDRGAGPSHAALPGARTLAGWWQTGRGESERKVPDAPGRGPATEPPRTGHRARRDRGDSPHFPAPPAEGGPARRRERAGKPAAAGPRARAGDGRDDGRGRKGRRRRAARRPACGEGGGERHRMGGGGGGGGGPRGGGRVGQPGATRDRTRPGPEEPRLSGRSGVEDPELVLGPGPKPL